MQSGIYKINSVTVSGKNLNLSLVEVDSQEEVSIVIDSQMYNEADVEKDYYMVIVKEDNFVLHGFKDDLEEAAILFEEFASVVGDF